MSFPHLPQHVLPSMSSQNGGILIIDNYDSFTHNIRNQLGKLGVDSRVVRNDALSESDISRLNPGAIVIGPGPGSPHNPEDIGITPEAIEFAIQNDRALLGICLGHQALAVHFGGRVIQAPEAIHGKTSKLDFPEPYRTHKPSDPSLFEGIDPDAEVMRYHSLCVDQDTLPRELSVTSVTRDEFNVIMSMQHRKRPLYGVQFHPESFATDDGLRILENFLRLAPDSARTIKQRTYSFADIPKTAELPFGLVQRLAIAEQKPFEILEFPCDLAPEQVYAVLHSTFDHMVFFESLPKQGTKESPHSYFGFDPVFVLRARDHELFLDNDQVPTGSSSPFDILAETTRILQRDAKGDVPDGQHFSGGMAGFLSYEAMQYLEPKFHCHNRGGASTFAYGYFDDGLVYDANTKRYSYFTRGRGRMDFLQQVLAQRLVMIEKPAVSRLDDETPRDVFEHRVQKIQDEEIRTGNSFQTVLSRTKSGSIRGSMAPLYLRMRELCPSAHMHAVKMGEDESIGSLPELAMHVIDGTITSLPLAGTTKRSGHKESDEKSFERLRKDPKEKAEHMMLVDLARNDIARVAELGSVTVPKELLMHRLDAGSVMHIASEVRGKLRKDILPIRALLTIAPMGTVSGAPKIRSMEIIDNHEYFPRGLYASSIGFIDVRGNVKATMGLRSIMRHGKELKIQSGAGIVMDSNPTAEYEETENKLQVAERTLDPFFS